MVEKPLKGLFALWAVVGIIVWVGLWGFAVDSGSGTAASAANTQTPTVTTDDPIPTTTSSPTETQSPSPPPTPDPTPTPTATPTPNATATTTQTPTVTPNATSLPTPSPSPTPTPEPTDTPESTDTPTPTDTLTPTETPEPTATPTPTPTATPTPDGTDTVVPTPTTIDTAFEVVDTRVTGSSVDVGEAVVISVNVSNPTDQQESGLVTLRVDNQLVATKGVLLDPGESKTVTFRRTFDQQGSHDLAVQGTELTTVFVVEPADGESSSTAIPTAAAGSTPSTQPTDTNADAVELVQAQGLADWIRQGYNASVRVTLANRGDTAASYTMQVTIDGQPVANKTVLVPANGETTESVEFPARSGTVRVAGTEVGSLTVSESFQAAADRTDDATNGNGPGFGFGTVAVGLLAVVIAARARTPSGRDD